MTKQPQAKQPPKVDPYRIFQQADNFFKAQETLYRTVQREPPSAQNLVLPALVLSAFASELFLKCLIGIETDATPPVGHNLFVLFKRLSNPTRKRLEERFEKLCWFA
jgi:hypothetical protein